MNLVLSSDPVLRKVCEPIDLNDLEKWDSIFEEMFKLLDQTKNGVGLAAPQVGLPYQAFVIINNNKKWVFINPKMQLIGDKTLIYKEGCLSLPNVGVEIERKRRIKIKYTSRYGKEFSNTFDGLMARIIQHEMDHLNGVLITDYLNLASI